MPRHPRLILKAIRRAAVSNSVTLCAQACGPLSLVSDTQMLPYRLHLVCRSLYILSRDHWVVLLTNSVCAVKNVPRDHGDELMFTLTPDPSPCELPGVQILKDVSFPGTPDSIGLRNLREIRLPIDLERAYAL